MMPPRPIHRHHFPPAIPMLRGNQAPMAWQSFFRSPSRVNPRVLHRPPTRFLLGPHLRGL